MDIAESWGQKITMKSSGKFQSIVFQLMLAFGIIIALSIFSNSFVYWVTSNISHHFGQLTNTSLPLVKANSNLQIEILRSVNALEEQIIKGSKPELKSLAIEHREQAWREINQSFNSLNSLAVDTGYPASELSAIRGLLDQLQQEQITISRIANTPDNEPALKILTEEAIPLVSSMVTILSSLIELEVEEEPDEDRRALFKLLADSRGSFSIAVSELRAFLLTKDQANIDGFDQAWIANTDAFVEIFEDYEEYFTDEQMEQWEAYGLEREKLAPITIRAFELQASAESNFATHHLSTIVEPISKDIEQRLDKLNNHVAGVSEQGIELTSNSVSNMVVTLVVASILTILIAGSISVLFSGRLKTRVNELLERAQRIATGNFKTKQEYFDKTSEDELGQLSYNFNNMTLSLSSTISTVKRQSRQVGHSAHQVAGIAADISEVAKSENKSYSEVMRVTESFMDLLFESSQAVEETKEVLEKANEQADLGIAAVDSNVAEMNRTVEVVTVASSEVEELKSASKKIEQVTQAISEVADQTSLIALNAAIEAARAGEQGRGFAVVAEEVRNLAQRTASSTDEIKSVIGHLLNKVSDVIALMDNIIKQVDVSKERADESGTALREMTNTVGNIIESNEEVAERSMRQMTQMQEMQFKLRQLFTSLQQNSEKAQIVSLIGNDLSNTSELVNQLMNSFIFDQDEVTFIDHHDARRSKRLDAKIKVAIKHDEQEFVTVTRDFSMVGIGVVLSDKLEQILEVDGLVAVTLYLPNDDYQQYMKQSPLSLPAKVVRKQQSEDFDNTYYGIELAPDTQEHNEKLSELYQFFDE